jgi:hypothetical protein
MHVRICSISIVIITLFNSPPAAASQAEEEEDGSLFSITDFTLRVGFYDISSNTKIRLNALDGMIGTGIDLEDDLNLDERKSTSYLAFSWRMAGRHSLQVEQFTLNRDGSQTLTGEIKFGDEVFEFGAVVDSFFNTKVTRVGYAYLLRDTKDFALALSAGLHVTAISTGITEINNQNFNRGGTFASVTAPLPVVGVTGSWKFNEKLFLYGRAQIFRLSMSDFSGRLDHASLKLEYDAFKHVGMGVGYDLFGLNLDIDRGRWKGNIEFLFRGPIVYLTGRF